MKVIFLGGIRSATDSKIVEVQVGDRETVRTLLVKLSGRFGEQFKNTLFDSTEELHPNVIIQHKGENIVTKKGLDTEIRNDDTVVVTQAVAGG